MTYTYQTDRLASTPNGVLTLEHDGRKTRVHVEDRGYQKWEAMFVDPDDAVRAFEHAAANEGGR